VDSKTLIRFGCNIAFVLSSCLDCTRGRLGLVGEGDGKDWKEGRAWRRNRKVVMPWLSGGHGSDAAVRGLLEVC
jgi:hypothetical protein